MIKSFTMESIEFWPFCDKFTCVIHSDDKDPDEIKYPDGIKRLEFRHYSRKDSEKKIITFPDTVTDLTLHINYGLEYFVLPKSLIRLTLGPYFNSCIKN